MLLARGHRGAGLHELTLALGDSLVVVPDLGLLLAEKRLARGEHRFARLDPRCSFRRVRVDLGERTFERTLPLGESRLLLGQLRGGLRPVAICSLELAELGRDLLLASCRSCLGGEQLGLQVGETLLLCGSRFGALRQFLLMFLERGLLGGDLRGPTVDLR